MLYHMTPTRTDAVEYHNSLIGEQRTKAIAMRTAARAFGDLADTLLALPSQGEIWDAARADLVSHAGGRAVSALGKAMDADNNGNALELQGVLWND
jgi:hypothetical protein